jgi:uncharacterized protein YkwD
MQAPRDARVLRPRRGRTLFVVLVLVCAGLTVASTAMFAGATGYNGSAARQHLNHAIVGMEPTPTGSGYWLVASDGGIFAYGDAHYYGSTGGIHLNKPIVGMASTRSGHGYWLVASDGGIFAFGDARYHGSTGGIHLNKPIVGMARTISGNGYWLVATDGGVFSFGDAHYFGSTGGIRLRKPIVAMAPSHTGRGYWMVASDGGIFTFGDARYHGSAGGQPLAAPIHGMAVDPSGEGYWMVSDDGHVYSYGNAPNYGSANGMMSGQAAVDISSSPTGAGYWVATQWGGVDTATKAGMRIDPNLVPRSGAEAIQFELVNRINTERVARELTPLYIDPTLAAYSSLWAQHLAATRTFLHQNLSTILDHTGGRLEEAGENLFAGAGPGARDAGTAHYALMQSPPHRANILTPEERVVGVGASCLNGELVVVEDFGTPTGIPLGTHPEPSLQPFASPNQGGSSC